MRRLSYNFIFVLQRFGAALKMETDMAESLANKNFAEASRMFESTKPVAEEILHNADFLRLVWI